MFLIWLFLGIVMMLAGIFNRQALRILGLKRMSEVFTTPHLKQSSKRIEQLGQWLMMVLGVSFLVQGLGSALPAEAAHTISLILLGLSALLFLAIFGIAIISWKVR